MKDVKTTLNNLTTKANREQNERIAYLLQAITNLENYDINAAAEFVNAADYGNNYDIVSDEALADMVKSMDELSSMIKMLADVNSHEGFYRLDGYGWAVDVDSDDLASYIEEMANELAAEIN